MAAPSRTMPPKLQFRSATTAQLSSTVQLTLCEQRQKTSTTTGPICCGKRAGCGSWHLTRNAWNDIEHDGHVYLVDLAASSRMASRPRKVLTAASAGKFDASIPEAAVKENYLVDFSTDGEQAAEGVGGLRRQVPPLRRRVLPARL